MHEWRLTRAIVAAVVKAATAQGALRVRAVKLALAPRAHLAPEQLRAQFALAAAGSIAAQARLEFVPADDDDAAPWGVAIASVEIDA